MLFMRFVAVSKFRIKIEIEIVIIFILDKKKIYNGWPFLEKNH